MQDLPFGIFKYLSPRVAEAVFVKPGFVRFKCGYPKEFNDPYELFLTIDFELGPEIVAFYKEVLGELRQVPVTCFSKSPIVVPMWSHYGFDGRGFVVEIDPEAAAEHFPESGFGEVDYEEGPDEGIHELIARAYEIGKPRYFFMLHQSVFSSAYYTKLSCWSYEEEFRMVVAEDEGTKEDNIVLAEIPDSCVRSIIAGPQSDDETVATLEQQADRIGCSFYQLAIGRSSPVPYLTDASRRTMVFSEGEIIESQSYCADCYEPTTQEAGVCSWCQIDSALEDDAARRNTYRMYANLGMLDDHIKSMKEISDKYR